MFDKAYFARQLLRTPFQHQGRGAHAIDCVGVVTHVCDRLNVGYVDPRNYPRNGNGATLLSYAAQSFEPCAEHEADVVLLRHKQEVPEHMGVCLGHTVVHAHALHRMVIEESLSSLRPYVHSFWKFKKKR